MPGDTDPGQSSDIVWQASSAIAAIRELERWFFGAEGFSPERAVRYIREEAGLCGADALRVWQEDRWWIIASDRDWLPAADSANTAFHFAVRYDEGGPNATRTEVLLTAFTRWLVTFKDGHPAIISDLDGDAEAWARAHAEELKGLARVIAFKV